MSPRDWLAWPQGLPLLFAAPALAAMLYVAQRRRERAVERLVGPRMRAIVVGARRRPKWLAPCTSGLALAFAIVALLRPLGGERVRSVEQRAADVVVCLDVSRSMLARDQAPSRLLAARREIGALAAHVHGDRLALVAFAGEARLLVPLTRDMGSFAQLLEQADPLAVRKGGTDLGAALTAALRALGGGIGAGSSVLLLTDGEDLEGRGRRVAQTCADRGVSVHCVAFGTSAGAKVPIDVGGTERFLTDGAGAEIVTTADPTSLRAIAAATGGEFVDATSRPAPLVDLYDRRISGAARRTFATDDRSERAQRFQAPLLGALLLGVLELWLLGRGRP